MDDRRDPASYISLKRTFFVYDRDLCKTEADPPDKMIVFIHPADTSQQTQSYLAGICSAMEEYLSNFTSSPPRVFELERDKFAMRKVGQWVMVLTGLISQNDSSLCSDLDMIYSAFCFLFGSFKTLLESVKRDDDAFVGLMRDHCVELIPYIRRLCPYGGAFESVPRTPLPPQCNRFFILASDILTSLLSENDNLGGIIMFDDSVLCTHLDERLSSHIVTRVESRFKRVPPPPVTPTSMLAPGSNLTMSSMSSMPVTPGAGVDYESEIITVFVDGETLAALRQGRPPVAEVGPDAEEQVKYHADEEGQKGGEFVGLYHLAIGRMTLTVLMNYAAVYSERHINVTRTLVANKLATLEAKLARTLWLAENTVHAPLPFQYVTYDRSHLRLSGSGVDATAGDADPRFRYSARAHHELFSSSDADLVLLRDAHGPVLGRRVFDQETVFASAAGAIGSIGGNGGSIMQGNASAGLMAAAAVGGGAGGAPATQPGVGVLRPQFVPAEFSAIEDVAQNCLQEVAMQAL